MDGMTDGIFWKWLWLPLSLAAMTAQAADQQWVHGSWVNLRSGPSADAKVVSQLSTNTPVTVDVRQGEWCEISARTPNVRGYVACRLLGEKLLTLADLGQPKLPDGAPNPDFNPARAFWIAPSVAHLIQAGDFFWATMLSKSQKENEAIDVYRDPAAGQKAQLKPHRFPIPEFEAMKARVQQGIVAPPSSRPAVVPWSTLKQAEPQPGRDQVMIAGHWLAPETLQLMKAGKLDSVKPSLFKHGSEIAPASASVEQLSAQFEILEQVRILGGAEWAHHRHDTPRVFGHWDIGSLRLSLQKPVVEYVVGRQGLAAALQWKAEETQDYKAEDYCTSGFSLAQRAKTRLPDYPRVKDPLVWFFAPKPLPYKKVAIKTMARQFEPDTEGKKFGRPMYSLLVMHEIDLDGDGVPDLSAWEVMGQPSLYEQPDQSDLVLLRITFANIAGEWHLLDMDSYGECT